MTGRQSMWVWGIIVVAVVALTVGFGRGTAAEPKAVKPEQLLPANSVIYLSGLNSADYQSAYDKTASHEALYKSGLMPALAKLVDGIVKQIPAEQAAEIHKALGLLVDKGMSLAVSIPTDGREPIPTLTMVLHEGASLEESITRAVTAASANSEVKLNETRNGSRTIHGFVVPETPGLEISWWSEGTHLVLVAGIKSVDGVLAIADGKEPNITTNPLWKKYRETPADPEQVLATIAWLDLPSIAKIYGKIPLPNPEKPTTVGDILEVIGLNEVGPVAMQSGYKGKTTWSVATVEFLPGKNGEATPPRTITLDDLPPMPANLQMFAAGTCDLSKWYDRILGRLRQGVKQFGPPKASKELEEKLQQVPEILGIDPKADLLDCLGNMYCLYQGGSMFQGTGGLMFAVRDPEKLQKTLLKLIERIPKSKEVEIQVEQVKKLDRDIITLSVQKTFLGISLAFDKNWLVVAQDSQTVQAALLRLDGKLERWQPGADHREALAALPQKFTSISVSDPRGGMSLLTGLAPVVVGIIETVTNNVPVIPIRMPISQIDLPPAEVVVKPMFPNVTVTVSGSDKWQAISRESVSVNANATIVGVGAVAVGTALVLPAVQQAREAARRTQSRNNMKQLGLAAHNFESAYRSFPPNVEDPKRLKLKPEERISWLADMLPFLEQQNLYNGLDTSKPWNDDANSQSARTTIPMLLHPSLPVEGRTKEGYGVTHYVGNGGLGEDGPNLPTNNPKAGAFGFNRKTRINDFRDGTSNTVMAAGAYKDFGPWIANTKATIRPLTKKPYLQGPDGIGNPGKLQGGMFLFSDGSVRVISKNVDPSVIESVYTINGGEAVGDF